MTQVQGAKGRVATEDGEGVYFHRAHSRNPESAENRGRLRENGLPGKSVQGLARGQLE